MSRGADAIRRSAEDRAPVSLDCFDYEDERALYDACEDFDRGDSAPETTTFFGPQKSWTVSLIGDGDPR